MQKQVAIIGAIVVGFGTTWAKTAEPPASDCFKLSREMALPAPCGAAFRIRARIEDGSGHGPEFDVIRAGRWQLQRFPGANGKRIYANSASGVTIMITHDPNGEPELSLTGGEVYNRGVPQRTEETIALLGEHCRVWVTPQPWMSAGAENQDCITPDGIPLLHENVFRKGATLGQKFAAGTPGFTRATSLRRTAVAHGEVRPPASLFDWSAWGVVAVPASAGAANYEVRLEDEGNTYAHRQPVSLTIRQLGDTELTLERQQGSLRRIDYRGAGRIVDFLDEPGNKRRVLRIYSAARRQRLEARLPKPAPLEKVETILGEQCRWYDMSPGMADASRAECRTDDGIPLARSETSWGMTSLDVRATFLRRGALQPPDLVAPDELIAGEFWLGRR